MIERNQGLAGADSGVEIMKGGTEAVKDVTYMERISGNRNARREPGGSGIIAFYQFANICLNCR